MSRTAKKANKARFSSGHISYTTEIADFLGQVFDKEEKVIVKGYESIRKFKHDQSKREKKPNPILGEGTPTPRWLRIANKKRRGREMNNIFIADDIEEVIARDKRNAAAAQASGLSTGRLKNQRIRDLAGAGGSFSSRSNGSASARSVSSFRSFASDDSTVSVSDVRELEELKRQLEMRLNRVNKKIMTKIQDTRFENKRSPGGERSKSARDTI